MFGKIIALVAVVAVVSSAESCGFCGRYLSSVISGHGLNEGYRFGVLNIGCTVPAVSAYPTCSSVATPSAIFEAAIASPAAVTPIASTPVVSSGILFPGLLGSGCNGRYDYGSTLNGCGNDVLASVC